MPSRLSNAPGTVLNHESLLTQWTSKQQRQFNRQVQQLTQNRPGDQRYDIIEVFSPPRFATQAAIQGQSCLSAGVITGWDFHKVDHRRAMRDIVVNHPPELLVCSPPCTWAGGWFHLSKMHMSDAELREKRTLTTLFINFCCELIEVQVGHGKHAMFEHPLPSMAWSMPRMPSHRANSPVRATADPGPSYQAPAPVEAPTPSHATLQPGTPALPPGVGSVTRWGQTVISFGKYKNRLSYAAFKDSPKEEDVGYKNWMCNHYKSGSPPLRDLVDYSKAVGDETILPFFEGQSVMIPGSNVHRRFTP